jgi:hypothetical protein
MSSLLIKNIGTLVMRKLESPLRHADSIYIEVGVVNATGSHQELLRPDNVSCGHANSKPNSWQLEQEFFSADFQSPTFRYFLDEA